MMLINIEKKGYQKTFDMFIEKKQKKQIINMSFSEKEVT